MRRGFSLVELSIVLVILGLLVGGVLAGQSLIRAAELRSVTSEYNRYYTATQSFRDKYFMLPGDITNATSFWGKDNTNCPAQPGTATTPGTCNGDGDGTIAWNTEGYRAWQHLANAGLIEGNYTGTATTNQSVIGTNVPASRITNAGWSYIFETAAYISSSWQGMVFGASKTNSYTLGATVITPSEAWNLDTKMDDGKPDAGKVRALSTTYWANCTTGVSPSIAYNLTDSAKDCALYFSIKS